MQYDGQRALELLRSGTGVSGISFRPGQEAAVRHVVEGRGRILVVQKTGWGKSFVYFIATKLLREAGAGPTLLISPLLALMRNQIAAAERMGVVADRITSDNKEHWAEVEARLWRDEVDVLLVSPERFGNQDFRDGVLAEIAERVTFLVIDEAHCISDWGHDFRPHYRLIERVVGALPPNLRVLATTATANNRVTDDLRQVLGPNLQVSRGDLNRPSLMLQTMQMPGQSERLAWLAAQVPKLPGHGIIYTLTIRDANQVAEWLQTKGIQVEAYTGQTENDRREELEQALLDNQIKALVATTALGMGFDKPDLAFVIHYQSPPSVVHYYQQVGRAGRAMSAAYGVLLSGQEETEIADYFIDSAFPTPDEVHTVIEALETHPNGLSIPALLGEVNVGQGRIEKTIQLLSLESPAPVVKEGSKWQLTAAALSSEFWARAERLTRLRREEQRQMQEYVELEEGHMAFLIQALDGELEHVTPPELPPLPTGTSKDLVRDAVTFLRRTNLPIEPRKKWPLGGMPQYEVKGHIPLEYRAEVGRALCIWRDAGWGELVRDGKYDDDRFADNLVEACLKLMERWDPQPAPEWATCIPSLRHPNLVPEFTERLATRLGLPFHQVLEKAEDRAEQKSMANSTQQARNADGALAVSSESLPVGPVLLVDDIVDSRWTLTVAAWLLRSHGSGEVWPLALAQTSRN
ncbi:MAG: RecQ family ATP-dependent DNA helicase [Gammaproteobacteria bacterium]|nr:RecQ family ATP-dependent DNA helicase [Gammaproteobacteria bacterium]